MSNKLGQNPDSMSNDVLFSRISNKFHLNDSKETRVYIHNHTSRVAEKASGFLKFLELDSFQQYKILQLAIYHDIGKLGVSPDLLFKAVKLSKTDVEMIRKHSEYGGLYISCFPELLFLSPLIKHHHERWDGSGYPDGLKTYEIPFECRILSIIDAFDAMISERCYKRALTVVAALDEIKVNSGSQFDPQMAALFIRFVEINLNNFVKKYEITV